MRLLGKAQRTASLFLLGLMCLGGCGGEPTPVEPSPKPTDPGDALKSPAHLSTGAEGKKAALSRPKAP